ncbi:zinc-dependent metalloprotease [Tamlana agarivorans]|uniref:Zinc-dependent metalloprotease n=1 Tax=Pseudotamlana agarivorans TaxID=481183 RepID=A0ACC5UCA7_9FLAO|nr:zinc-dependent metalloprotease [Tamlana agarivorans]MBU2951924.1 zinc-dependent metalloprotease [Tamlana agarivorans]
MKNILFVLFALILSPNLTYSQIQDDLLPFEAVSYPKIDDWHIAVFPIDFTDIPSKYRAGFPSKDGWSQTVFQGDISSWFQDMSYGTTTITGDVFDYTTSSEVFFDTNTGQVASFDQVLGGIDITAAGFNINNYDFVVFIFCHDAAVQQSITKNQDFTINGTSYNQQVVTVSYQNGQFHRDPGFPEVDQLNELNKYLIATGTDTVEEGDVNYTMSHFEAVLLHELGHSMGLDNHANSSTNGNKAAHETPEVANNGSLLNENYGNKFDIMGSRDYGIGMNGAMRDLCGLINAETIYSKNWWGKTLKITVNPVTAMSGKRFIEVLLPDQRDFLGLKRHGYQLEVKTIDGYYTMLNNPELDNNTNGFFVHKISGTEDLLLDMSPSSNINYFGDYLADIRDVVLKPGMTYENDDVIFENVVDNNDGSWSIDITIKADLIITPEPTFSSATRLLNGNIQVEWVNNCNDCGNNEQFIISYRKVGEQFWNSISDADLNSGTYMVTTLTGNTDTYEFRGAISGSATHYDSLYSNTVSTSSLGIEEVLDTAPSIYPNPSSHIVNIDIDEIFNVVIYNAVGKMVLEKSNSKQIDVQNLKPGIYFLKIITQGKIFYHKILKK